VEEDFALQHEDQDRRERDPDNTKKANHEQLGPIENCSSVTEAAIVPVAATDPDPRR
jgi:hypothetical protein